MMSLADWLYFAGPVAVGCVFGLVCYVQGRRDERSAEDRRRLRSIVYAENLLAEKQRRWEATR